VGKSKVRHSTDGILGQHLALSVAAHLARTQLVPDPLAIHDARELAEMLDIVAGALAKVAPLYVQDPGSGTPRPLMPNELEDGRSLSSVFIKRSDLRQAIALLKALGIPELQGPRAQAEEPKPKAAEPGDPLETVAELEKLLSAPLLPLQAERASRLLVSIARHAPRGRVANLAMQLMSALHESRYEVVEPFLAQLRAAMEEATKGKG
jgi:hypothetical protein